MPFDIRWDSQQGTRTAGNRDHAGIVMARLLPGRRSAGLVRAAVAVAVVWLIAANAASIRTPLMLADITIPPERPPPLPEPAASASIWATR